MPKGLSDSPPPPSLLNKMSSRSSTAEDVPAGMSELQMRKKKNADAQAAFRQRRANYIATLEETVTSLEAVVIQLQDSCREARNRATELERENARLKRTCNELWKTVGHRSRHNSTGPTPDTRNDDVPPPSPHSVHTFSAPPAESSSTSPMTLFPEDGGFRFPSNGDGPMALGNPSYRSPTQTYPSSSQAGPDGRGAPFESSPIQGPYPPYGGPPQHGRDGAGPWPPSRVETGPPSNSNTEGGGYVFAGSRSMSPNPQPQSPPSSSGSANHFPFNFGEGDRHGFDMRRPMQGGPDFLMHGGTADVSSLAQRVAAAAMPPYPPVGSRPNLSDQHEEPNDIELEEAERGAEQSRRRSRRSGEGERSPSPSMAPISSTLAVIKAQAFGALRRTRAKTRKSAEGGAKIALQALQARGIDLGLVDPEPPTKRPRHEEPDYKEDDTGSPP